MVEQFAFPKNLTRGKRLRVICTVTEGDLPIDVQWRFNHLPILPLPPPPPPPSPALAAGGGDIQIRRIDEYTSLLAISDLDTDHAGNYTCAARNMVAESVRSAVLTIRGSRTFRVSSQIPFLYSPLIFFDGLTM